jgi:hypothetical protein
MSTFHAIMIRLGDLTLTTGGSTLTYCLLFSIILNSAPPYLSENFRPLHRPLSHLRSSPSSSLDLAVPLCRTSTYQHSFCSSVCSMWDALPPAVRRAASVNAFRRLLFAYLRSRGRDALPLPPARL